MANTNTLSIADIYVHFYLGNQIIKAVDSVSLTVPKNSVIGLVGESGCGKSTLGRAILRLVPLVNGSVIYEGTELANLNARKMLPFRTKMQMIFQDPYASLNPRMTVLDILSEPIIYHKIVDRKNVLSEVLKLMDEVGLSRRFIRKYPHEFSGGQRQRIAVARALSVRPQFIVADEPVSALDVSIQAQVLNLLANIQRERGLSLLFISHDLSVVRHICNETAVMYLGRIIEQAPTEQLFTMPRHPYTKALLSAIPLPDPVKEKNRTRILLEGDPPSPMNIPTGCRFHPRCKYSKDICTKSDPKLLNTTNKHYTACLRIAEINEE